MFILQFNRNGKLFNRKIQKRKEITCRYLRFDREISKCSRKGIKFFLNKKAMILYRFLLFQSGKKLYAKNSCLNGHRYSSSLTNSIKSPG